jgi:hypothetical protein
MHPEIVARLNAIRHAELVAEADRYRSVAALRGRARRRFWPVGRTFGWQARRASANESTG